MIDFETQYWNCGLLRLAGVDEAGRGPLAGPVVAAAVVFDREFVLREIAGLLKNINDSKKLTEKSREQIFSVLEESEYVDIGVGVSEVDEIDSINILNATHRAMGRAVDSLSGKPDHVLVDGLPVKGLHCASTSIIRGDSRSISIAAASIIAKVTRDRIMVEMDGIYPEYGLAKHKGYGTRQHLAALLRYGPTPQHRLSFGPVKNSCLDV